MHPALRPPVPSRGLLRFLRSQSKRAFASCSDKNGPAVGAVAAPALCRRARSSNSPTKKQLRSLGTTCGRRTATLESSFLDMEPLLRRLRPRDQVGAAKSSFGTTSSSRKWFKWDDTDYDTPTWQERLWGSSARKGAKPLKPDDLPSHDEFGGSSSMFSSRRSLAAKAASEPRLRCTEVDEHGKVILVDGEFKKTELIAKYGLLPRDLRKIDSSNLPHILVRPSAILLNLLHLKVLIKHDRVLLFDVYGSKTSYPQSAFMYDLQGKLQQKNSPNSQTSGFLPYEFRALEAVLTSVTSELEADFESVREPVMHILSELEDDIDRQKLRVLLIDEIVQEAGNLVSGIRNTEDM